jgi:ABC-type phosphate transport system substrate-binding protein
MFPRAGCCGVRAGGRRTFWPLWRAFAAVGGVTLITLMSAAPSRGASPVTEYRVIVNPANPIRSLTREDVAAYFLRRRTNWPQGPAVSPVDLAAETSVRDTFSREVLHRTPSAVSAYWVQQIFAGRSEPPPVKDSEAAVVEYVIHTPWAIGYVSVRSVTSGVQVIEVKP